MQRMRRLRQRKIAFKPPGFRHAVGELRQFQRAMQRNGLGKARRLKRQLTQRQMLPLQIGLHAQVLALIIEPLRRAVEGQPQRARPALIRIHHQLLYRYVGGRQQRLPLRQGARRGGRGIVIGQLTQAGAVERQTLRVGLPA